MKNVKKNCTVKSKRKRTKENVKYRRGKRESIKMNKSKELMFKKKKQCMK